MPIGRFFGVRVTVSWPFLGLLLLAAVFGYWPHVALLFGTLLAHELAHLMVAQAFEVGIGKVELQPYGGIAYLVAHGSLDPYAETAIAAAGPANNFILLAAGVLVQRWNMLAPDLLDFFLEVNITMAIFNLLPALPLDGGRIYRAFLRRRVGFDQATRRLARLGRMIGFALVLGAIVGLAFRRLYLPALLFAPFLMQGARHAERQARYELWIDVVQRRDRDPSGAPQPVQTLMVPLSMPLSGVARLFQQGRFHVFTLTDDRRQIVGQLDEGQVIDALLRWGPTVTAGEAWEKLGGG